MTSPQDVEPTAGKWWPLLTGSLTIRVVSGIVWSVGDSRDVVHKVIKLETWQNDVCAIHLCCNAMMLEHSAPPCLALWRPPAPRELIRTQHRIIGYSCRLWLIQLFAFVIIQESCPLELGLIRDCLCVFFSSVHFMSHVCCMFESNWAEHEDWMVVTAVSLWSHMLRGQMALN